MIYHPISKGQILIKSRLILVCSIKNCLLKYYTERSTACTLAYMIRKNRIITLIQYISSPRTLPATTPRITSLTSEYWEGTGAVRIVGGGIGWTDDWTSCDESLVNASCLTQ